MALIFSASADSGSGQRSSRIIGPIVRWFSPNISEAALDRIVVAVRKCAHVTEFAVLAILLELAWRATRPLGRSMLFAFSAATLYAASDEIHQTFVPNRGASITDVLIDMVGITIGLCLLFIFRRWRRSVRPAPDAPTENDTDAAKAG